MTAETWDAAIACRDLWKSFVVFHQTYGSLKVAAIHALRRRPRETVEVLRGLTLAIAKGETVAIVGRNGSGKSTFLSLVAGVYRPTRGHIEVHGTVAPLLELGAGFHPDLTGVENIELYGSILGMSRRRIREQMDSIIAFAFDRPDMASKIDTPLRNYSEGMKMRLGFSIAVHTEPDILLVDEVLAVGDEAFQAKCLRRIQQFQAEGRTILFVSHDMAVVRKTSTRTIWLDQGTVKMDGPTADVVDAYVSASQRLDSRE